MKLISDRKRIKICEYSLDFYLNSIEPLNLCYGFPCEANGSLKPFSCDAARENYARCVADPRYVSSVTGWTHSYVQPATIECDCGAIVSLDDCMTNVCGNCGQFWNGSAQRLCHPRFWGEETGEQFSDSGSPIL